MKTTFDRKFVLRVLRSIIIAASCIVAMLCSTNAIAQTYSWLDGIGPHFQPDVPSSANGPVDYTYEFFGWTRGLDSITCTLVYTSLDSFTEEYGTVGPTVARCRGVAEYQESGNDANACQPFMSHNSNLGRWVVNGNNGSHTVKLFYGNGTEVPGSAVTVNTAGQTAGQFAYSPLAAPITLAANTTYAVMSYEVVGGDTWYDYRGTQITLNGAASAPFAVWAYTPPPYNFALSGSGQSYGPVNVLFCQ